MGDLPFENFLIFGRQLSELLCCLGVLSDECALLEVFNVFIEIVLFAELLNIGEELLLRDIGKWVLESGAQLVHVDI